MVGYSNPGKYVDCSYTGKITCSTGSLGGILGYTKTNQTMEGCSVNAEITGGASAGLFIGGSEAGKTYTFGTKEKSCTVFSDSKVKSATVTPQSFSGLLVGNMNAVTVNAGDTILL